MEGAGEGVLFYLKPDFVRLADPQVTKTKNKILTTVCFFVWIFHATNHPSIYSSMHVLPFSFSTDFIVACKTGILKHVSLLTMVYGNDDHNDNDNQPDDDEGRYYATAGAETRCVPYSNFLCNSLNISHKLNKFFSLVSIKALIASVMMLKP